MEPNHRTRTLIESGQPVPTTVVYYGFTALAMYDAVVTIEGRYEPWSELPRAHAHASPEVAAGTATYRVLSHYFPNSAAALAADYEAALAEMPNGVGKVHGIRVGEDAAAALIARRAGDGRGAAVPEPQDEPLEPGEWRRTPPAFTPMVGTWLGFVEPLLIPSPTHFPLPGPPALDSAQYATEFAEVRDYGRDVSQARTDQQTATGLFHTVAPRFQHIEAIRDQITDRHLDIVDSARTLAVLMGSLADFSIACWRAKNDFKFWRPVTAIAHADTDGNQEPTSCRNGHRCATRRPTRTTSAATPASPGRSRDRSTTAGLVDGPPRLVPGGPSRVGIQVNLHEVAG